MPAEVAPSAVLDSKDEKRHLSSMGSRVKAVTGSPGPGPSDAPDCADASECTTSQHFQNENRVACPDGLSEPQRLAIELVVMGERDGKIAKKVGGEPLDPLARIIHILS